MGNVEKLAKIINEIAHLDATSSEVDDELGLTHSKCNLVHFIARQGDCTMSEIAEFLNVSHARATMLIDELVEKKMVTRKHDKEDRRKVLVSLSAQGSVIKGQMMKKFSNMSKALLKNLSGSEQKELIRLLSKASD